jgi:hypothetical protein
MGQKDGKGINPSCPPIVDAQIGKGPSEARESFRRGMLILEGEISDHCIPRRKRGNVKDEGRIVSF